MCKLCKQTCGVPEQLLELKNSWKSIRNRLARECCFISDYSRAFKPLFFKVSIFYWNEAIPSSKEPMTPVLLSNRYQVLSVLGDGGFGKTFLVEDTQMPSNRQCVLKQLKPVHDNPQTSQMVKDRFQREAAILEKLGEAHDQIPRLYAYFSEADQFYLVEEWVAGDTLTQRVQQAGPLSEKAVQTLIAELLPAIAHVHREGIVHRDIKPDNIILRARDGKPVLIDFGAVKETMNTLIDSHAHSSHSIVVGTPGYMPAEQLSGRPVFASDIYSIGMTAIYALTGKMPQELEINPRTGELLWRQHAPNVSTEFGNFLDCAIHMSAQSRFPTVEEMRSILNTLILKGMTASPSDIPETRQSSQTIVSAPPPAAPAYAYQSMESANTEAIPVAPSSTFQQPATQFAQPANYQSGQQFVQSSGQPSGQWKNAVIIGGMVGFSLLLGILLAMDRLPSAMGDRLVADNPVEVDSVEKDASDAVAEKPTPKIEDSEISTPDPAPVAAPTQPQPASVLGANSTIVGDPGATNIRSGAGSNYAVVDVVQVGDRVKAVDRATDSNGQPWYRVMVPSGSSGWVFGQLIQVDGDAALPEAQAEPEGEPEVKPVPSATPADNTNAAITGQSGSKNIRSGPGTNYDTAHIAYPGDRIVIRDTSTDSGGYTWYKVYFPKSGAEGWIAAQLVSRD